jgi:hypothetical protein
MVDRLTSWQVENCPPLQRRAVEQWPDTGWDNGRHDLAGDQWYVARLSLM